jgi:hypothetical protein
MAKLKEIGLDKNTYIYIVTDHGFDEDGFTDGHNHFNAPFGIFASNDSLIKRSGDRKDLVPTLLEKYGLDLNKQSDTPMLNGLSLFALPTSTCVKESDAYLDYPQAPKCCAGLKLINLDQKVTIKKKNQNDCHPATGGANDKSGYCTKCGNNICASPENECNCATDCDATKKAANAAKLSS